MNWKQYFEPHILERGRTYWEEGAVTQLDYDDDVIDATVEGTEEYEVSIDLDGGQVVDMSCTCPYAEDGKNCKHMAAALFAWEDEKQSSAPKLDWEKALSEADDDTVRSFLSGALRADAALRRRFMDTVAPETTRQNLVQYVRASVDKIIDRYMKYDCVEYDDAEDFIDEMDSLLSKETDARLQKGQCADAFDVAAAVFLALDGVDIEEDEDYSIWQIAEHCETVWQEALRLADDTLRQKIYHWLMEHSDGICSGYLKDICQEALVECFHEPQYLREILAKDEKRLQETMAGEPSDDQALNGQRYALRCLGVMQKLNEPENTIRSFCKRYRRFPDVYRAYIRICQEAGRWEEAAQWLEAAIKSGSRRNMADHVALKNAYAHLGRDQEYRQELRYILTDVLPGHMESFREYRALFSPEEWPAVRERLFADMKNSSCKTDLYAEEGLYDRLLRAVLDSGDPHMMRRYETELVQYAPEAVLSVYAENLRRAARATQERSVYESWVFSLRHMREIPGGNEVVEAIVREWRSAYKKRRAMMEELDKL